MPDFVSGARSAWRSCQFLAFIFWRISTHLGALAFSRKARDRASCAHWLQKTAEGCRRILHLQVSGAEDLPSTGLLVANHLGYLDIVLLASQQPCVFVAKKEVRAWPIFGDCARLGGTIFVDRTRRTAVADVAAEMRTAIEAGLLVVLFPEGTSSGGDQVLPFKSALLEPATQIRCAVATAAIGYRLERGDVAEEICYWKDMTLLPHLWHLFGIPRIEGFLRVGVPQSRRGDRKALATDLQQETATQHRLLPSGNHGRTISGRPHSSDEFLHKRLE